MSKDKSSKFDPYRATLVAMDQERKTLAEMVAWLKGEGLAASISSLSDYLGRLRSERQQAAVLGMIVSGATMNKELDAAFAKNPAVQLERLIAVVKTLVMSLQVRGQEDPALLELSNVMLKSVLDFAKLEVKKDELNLQRDKFQFDAAAAALAKLAELNAIKRDGSLSEDAKLDQARLKLFGELPT